MSEIRRSLLCRVVSRDSRSVVVERDATHARIALEDRTGDVELLLGLLDDGRSCAEAISQLTAHRDGVAPAAVWSALDALQGLGLLASEGAQQTPLAA